MKTAAHQLFPLHTHRCVRCRLVLETSQMSVKSDYDSAATSSKLSGASGRLDLTHQHVNVNVSIAAKNIFCHSLPRLFTSPCVSFIIPSPRPLFTSTPLLILRLPFADISLSLPLLQHSEGRRWFCVINHSIGHFMEALV